jgi:predicted transcriptional regulator
MSRNRKADDLKVEDAGTNGPALLALTTEIVCSYLSYNHVPITEITTILRSVHSSLASMSGATTSDPAHTPAVPVKKSVTDDFIICLEDGKKLRTLKRYLKTQYDLTPEDYRAKWQLPRDYPMVAPAYTRMRSAFARKIGLGRVPTGRTRKAKQA